MSTNTNLTEEDYLRIHLQNLEQNQSVSQEPVPPQVPKMDTSKSSDLNYFSFDINEFPCNVFYPQGTIIQVRAAQVKEVQSYSMVDDKNFYDIIEKMNEMLSSCVRVKYSDGTFGTYLDIKDADRFYLIFLIRELTFQKGTTLSTTARCSCGLDVNIDLVRVNFKRYDVNEKLKPHFDNRAGCFKFELTNNKMYLLSAPSIGVQKSFTEYIISQNAQKKKPNLSFLKIVPFLCVGKNSLNQEEIKLELEKFQKMDDISFQFLNSAVEKMTFGIEELQSYCQCGLEIHTPMVFPNGPSAIFVIHDAFDKFIKK